MAGAKVRSETQSESAAGEAEAESKVAGKALGIL
jgi:hypothetical protein